VRNAVLKAVLGRQGHHRVSVFLCGQRLSALLGEDSGKEFRIHQTGRVSHLLSPREHVLTPLLGLIRSAQRPEGWCEADERGHPGIMPTADEQGSGKLGLAEVQTVLQMGTGGDQVSTKERDIPHGHMTLQHRDRVGLV
jgi:hypothetical protein